MTPPAGAESSPVPPLLTFPVESPLVLLLSTVAAAIGAGMNAIAGGGTLVTFPALVALGVPPIVANATSTVALWPGSMSSLWGYRAELVGARRWAIAFAIPSLLGGILGAVLLLHTPERSFAAIVPWLILGATSLFIAQQPLTAALKSWGMKHPSLHSEDGKLLPPSTAFLIYQFFISIYGGYFGAGVGILMLAALGLMGLTNIHQMNGLKNWGAGVMNLVAVIVFAVSGIVNWRIALAMGVGATAGGIGGSLLAQRIGKIWVRRIVISIGLISGVVMLFKLR